MRFCVKSKVCALGEASAIREPTKTASPEPWVALEAIPMIFEGIPHVSESHPEFADLDDA